MSGKSSLLLERCRFVLSLVPQALAVGPGGIVGWFVRMGEAGKLIFAIVVDMLADGETAVCTVVEATDAAGTGAQNIATATATATAGTGASRMQLTMNAPAIGSTVTITVGGVVHIFTAAGAENLVTHAFNQSAGDNATATSLAACINSVLYGIAQVTAVANGPVVLLTVDETGDYTITCAVSTPLTIMPVTLEAVVLIELEGTALTPGFNHVAIRVAGPVTAHAAAIAVQGDLRFSPMTQPVAAQDTDS
jgi:hypothetical protein